MRSRGLAGSLVRQRLAVLALIGLLLLNFPLLAVPVGELAGIPALLLWIFVVWLLLIVAAALLSERRGH